MIKINSYEKVGAFTKYIYKPEDVDMQSGIDRQRERKRRKREREERGELKKYLNTNKQPTCIPQT